METALLFRCILGSVAAGLGLYWLGGGLFYYCYYIHRRDEAAEWKCQPQRFPSRRMHRQDMLLGSLNITFASVLSGIFAAYVIAKHGGRTTLILSAEGHSAAALLLGALVYFLLTDAMLYFAHRIYHKPTLFRWIHRHHHRNPTPTPFTAFSMHPIEFLTFQSVAAIPLFLLPVHYVPVVFILLYNYYVALVQHSGVRLHFGIPWEPATYFHDDHHAHFHCNYGQHLTLWDRLFGTLRRHGRRYGASVFGGRGAPDGPTKSGPTRFFDYHKHPWERELP